MTALAVHFDRDGLAPAIVQDAATHGVLMLGYVNEESLRTTRDTGLVTFWSRSRNRLWQKGETSGNTLRFVDLALDCDGDAVLIRARPDGPTCHTGARTCFEDDDEQRQGLDWLEALWDVVVDRKSHPRPDSYTTSLLEAGVDLVSRKVAEEATEVVIAAKNHATGGDRDRVVSEAADLVFHLFVLLAERGVEAGEVVATLRDRSA